MIVMIENVNIGQVTIQNIVPEGTPTVMQMRGDMIDIII